MKLSLGTILVLCCFGQDLPVARMFDSKLTEAQRNDACFALRGDQSPDVLKAMRSALNVDVVRTCAARNLAEAGAGDLLADAVRDPEPQVRAIAARQLGVMQGPEFIPLLAAAAEDPNILVATSATQGLCQYTDDRVLPALRKIAGRSGLAASISLSRIAALDPSEALPFARKLLTGADVSQRLIAIGILGQSGDASDLPALRVVAENKRDMLTPQRGFGLMPAIDLSLAAQATIAQIEHRTRP